MTEWRNRIVGEGVQAASQFIANQANWRVHGQPQRDAMRGALNEVGWVQRVIVNRQTGYLVDGHERVWQALQNGDAEVPYVEVDLAPDEEAYVLATLDPIGAMAAADSVQLAELLREVQSGEAGVQAMLESLAMKTGIIPPNDPMAEWQGMPEFQHEDITAEGAFTIRVFLKDANDLAAFGRLLGRDLTGRKFVWFSKQPHGDLYEVYDEKPA